MTDGPEGREAHARSEAALEAPLLDHGVFGNGRVLALVSPTSAIDWLCMPRFDAPSVFASLLDDERGGTFRFLHHGRVVQGRMQYVTNTNVLITRFSPEPGVAWEVVDFAPRIPVGLGVDTPIEIIRVLRPVEGVPRLSVHFDPRPDYATVPVELSPKGQGIEVLGGSSTFHLLSNLPTTYIAAGSEFSLREPLFFVFACGRLASSRSTSAVMHDLERTVAGWRAWAKTCSLPTFRPDAVLRSALCLKLHVFEDTGAIIAATTTSIPEAMGTQRTWDYRYCWLRDSAFIVEALRRLSHLTEGERFIGYLRDVAESGPLQPLYGIGGERELPEVLLPHLRGFGGNGWVRIGNAAAIQRQNDLNGEIILCLETMLRDPRIVTDDPASYVPLVERLVEEAIVIAHEPDTSIWEFRTLPRHYTFSRALCWVAMARGAELAEALGRPDLAARWSAEADANRDVVLERGFNRELGFFTQVLDGHFADASNLLFPSLGLIDARDPRFLATLDAYEERLVRSGFMLRYANDDDFGETTSAFTMCSFWWCESLALAGRIEEAIRIFDHLLAFANPLGLFSEDVDPPTGKLLGNFPQAYTHVGLIHAAMTISELLEARDGRVRAWT